MIGFHTNLNYVTHDRRSLPKVNVVQVFACGNTSFYPKKDQEEIDLILQKKKELNLDIVIHAPYVCSFNEKYFAKTICCINKLIDIAGRIDVDKIVVHAATYTKEQLLRAFKEIVKPSVILLENGANGNFLPLNVIGEVAREVGCGVCLDIAHYHDSGDTTMCDHDLVKLVHANCMNGKAGNKRDRHGAFSCKNENFDLFKETILKFKDKPWITEVNEDLVNEEIETLRNVRTA
jgi:endonuclease IV